LSINERKNVEYKMPKNIKDQLTKEVMTDFRLRVIETFKRNDVLQGRKPYAYENSDYYTWWLYMEGTHGFCESFRKTCMEFRLQSILDTYNQLSMHDSVLFDCELSDLLITYGLIEEGDSDAINYNPVGEE
jgi:hypothetical protein